MRLLSLPRSPWSHISPNLNNIISTLYKLSYAIDDTRRFKN